MIWSKFDVTVTLEVYSSKCAEISEGPIPHVRESTFVVTFYILDLLLENTPLQPFSQSTPLPPHTSDEICRQLMQIIANLCSYNRFIQDLTLPTHITIDPIAWRVCRWKILSPGKRWTSVAAHPSQISSKNEPRIIVTYGPNCRPRGPI